MSQHVIRKTRSLRLKIKILQIRNPNNRADAWEQKTLQEFSQKASKSAPINGLEKTTIMNINGKKSFRYMKAIPVGKACLTCHGSKISGQVATVINDRYPEDQATGYKEGELRGAFSLFKIID